MTCPPASNPFESNHRLCYVYRMADSGAPAKSHSAFHVSLYGLMIAGVVLAFIGIRSWGEKLSAPPASAGIIYGTANGQVDVSTLLHVLLALALVITTARLLGSLFRAAHQPPVIGEIIAGILLGPSLLGRFAPSVSHYLLPATIAPFLNVIAQVGVILYMFLVGLELDPGLMRQRGQATVAISHASIITPFLMGSLLALLLYPIFSSRAVPFTNFALFLGVSMSVTAFPVLARILTDRRIHKTHMGTVALTCAAVDDITAWCLLAFVVSVARAQSAGAMKTIVLAGTYLAAMLLIVRPAMVALSRIYGNRDGLTQGLTAVIFVALLLSSSATELIGIHAIFGAFALGAIIPHDSQMARELTDRLEDLVVVLLLPAFFAFTGLRTQIGLVSGPQAWLLCGLIILVASAGKFGGSLLAARITGLGWREGSALGVLMNTRGLMELIVLNIGLEMHVISPTLFALLVIMALVTTFATTPILHLITRRQGIEAEPPVIGRILASSDEPDRGAILVPIADPKGVTVLVEMALAASPPDAPPPRVLALVRPPVGGVRSGLREAEQRVAPRSPALSAALDHAWESGAVITPQAVWSDDPANDIVRTAADAQIGWILLGAHRAVFGNDFTGGVVHRILDSAHGLRINVGVVIHSGDSSFPRVCAVADCSADGRAAMGLAARIALQRECELHAFIVLAEPVSPDVANPTDEQGNASQVLAQMLTNASKMVGRRLHPETLPALDSGRIAQQTKNSLVIIAASLADDLEYAGDGLGDGRALILVQGSEMASSASARRWFRQNRAHRQAG
jgi:Kef-type K+ transport system membrane component KefB